MTETHFYSKHLFNLQNARSTKKFSIEPLSLVHWESTVKFNFWNAWILGCLWQIWFQKYKSFNLKEDGHVNQSTINFYRNFITLQFLSVTKQNTMGAVLQCFQRELFVYTQFFCLSNLFCSSRFHIDNRVFDFRFQVREVISLHQPVLE